MDNYKIKEMQKIARRKGGKCISQIYLNNKTNLQWECAQGHRWEATPNSVKRGTWCGKCAGKTKLNIQEMQKLATEHGGNCLSNTYVNKDSKLLWECAEGHKWKATPGSVKRGSWCRRCAGTEKGSIDEMSQIAETRDGKCLSKVYGNSKTKLLWECAEGHRWWATPSNIKNRESWCNVCAAKIKAYNKKLGIDKMHSIAKDRGGKCLSKIYVNTKTKLLWECEIGHQWTTAPSTILQGRWCPECSSGLGERICREFFEQLFEDQFVKSYPKWLINENGNQMELDGFCQNLKLAFEHHGRQHYTSDTFFYKSDNDFKVRQKLDRQKKMLCKKNRITLIEVPEIPTMLPIEGVKKFIKFECKKRGVSLPIDYDKREVKLQKALINLAAKEALSELNSR